MLGRSRIRKAHRRFLESCRSLTQEQRYWQHASPLTRWFLQTMLQAPLLGLGEEGKALQRALEWLESHCRKVPLGEDVLRQYHGLIDPTGSSGGGEYRKSEVEVHGSAVPRAPSTRVPTLMKLLDQRLREDQASFDRKPPEEVDLLRSAVDLHQRIGLIHPFRDGNGRVSRLAMNHLLRRYGRGYVILPELNRSPELMNALQDAHRGNLEALLSIATESRVLV